MAVEMMTKRTRELSTEITLDFVCLTYLILLTYNVFDLDLDLELDLITYLI